MNIKSLYEDIRNVNGLYDLFRPTIKYDIEGVDIQYNLYVVGEEDEMRLDLIIGKMYKYDSFDDYNQDYLENMDIICTINNIDNPLNIKKGMILKYPNPGEFSTFRIREDEIKSKDISKKLAFPNKKTKVDPSRKKYVESSYSYPPTVNTRPKNAVSIENGKFKIGGI